MHADHAIHYDDVFRNLAGYGAGRPCHVAVAWEAEAFRASEGEPMTVRRARALNAVLERCELPVWPGDLLVGCGRFGRFAAEGEVSEPDRAFLAGIGRRSFSTHADHHVPDYPTLLRLGFGGLRRQAAASPARGRAVDEDDLLRSVDVALHGASDHFRRWARALEAAVANAGDYADIVAAQARSMEHLAEHPARTFWEALLLVTGYHCMMQLDLRQHMAFGRVDQYMLAFYRADVESGRMEPGDAQSLLDHFFARLAAFDEVQNITIGGVRAEDGADASNELTLMILEACRRVGRPGGNVTARIHSGSPDEYLRKCAEVVRTGIGYPSVFNDDVEIPALTELGYPPEVARDYAFAGCIEVVIPGRSGPWSDARFNLPRCLSLALYDGVDSLTGERVAEPVGAPATFEEFYAAFMAHTRRILYEQVEARNRRHREVDDRAPLFTSPLMSAVTADCIERGRDVNGGGARYPGDDGIAAMGIGTVADSLMAVKRLVYEEERFTPARLREVLDADFEGYEAERRALLAVPKYGNDDEEVDALARRAAEDFARECLEYRNPQGGRYFALLAANVQNVQAGYEVGGTPDGRCARKPLSDAASPTFGRDVNGPTAVLKSVARLPWNLCPAGNVVNMKLHPTALAGDAGLDALAALIRTCFALGGIQLQFNVVDARVLRRAMEQPEEHAGLVVRVSGFSARYVGLHRDVQEDILARTEHASLGASATERGALG